MTIKAELMQGPKGFGLPQEFSITGAGKDGQQGAVVVAGTKFVGFEKGAGGYVEVAIPYEHDFVRYDWKPGETDDVTIFVGTNEGKGETATYKVTGE